MYDAGDGEVTNKSISVNILSSIIRISTEIGFRRDHRTGFGRIFGRRVSIDMIAGQISG